MSFDEMYDEMLHDEFRGGSPRRGAHASQRPGTRLSRYRNAGLVGAGGLACAGAGAFLGGLGGFVNLWPASVHSVTTHNEGVALAAAANAAYHGASTLPPALTATGGTTDGSNDSTGAPVATFAAAASPLLNGGAPLQAPTVDNLTGAGSPGGTPGGGTPGGSPPAGTPTPPPGGKGGLTTVLSRLTTAISDLTTLPSNPTRAVGGAVTPLTGVLAAMTGTLSDLSTLMPLPSPVGTAGTLPVVAAASPASRGPSTGGSPQPADVPAGKPFTTTPSPSATALSTIASSLALPPTGSNGSGTPAIPSLPLPLPLPLPVAGGTPAPVPSLPVTTGGTRPALPVVGVPAVTSNGSTTCVSGPGIKMGPLSVGVSKAGASSPATVCIPS